MHVYKRYLAYLVVSERVVAFKAFAWANAWLILAGLTIVYGSVSISTARAATHYTPPLLPLGQEVEVPIESLWIS